MMQRLGGTFRYRPCSTAYTLHPHVPPIACNLPTRRCSRAASSHLSSVTSPQLLPKRQVTVQAKRRSKQQPEIPPPEDGKEIEEVNEPEAPTADGTDDVMHDDVGEHEPTEGELAAAESDAAGEGEGEGERSDAGPEASTSYGQGEKEYPFPEPPARVYYLAQLFAIANLDATADWLHEHYPDLQVDGLQCEIDRVCEGDLYFCMPDDFTDMPQLLSAAVAQGATAIAVGSATWQKAQDFGLEIPQLPETLPLLVLDDLAAIAQQVAVAFYGAPARDLAVLAVCGSQGKTTTAWLIRGILEEAQQVAGMVGSVEYALAEYRLDQDGEFWEPLEIDPTAARSCSAPFRISPYMGKYEIPGTTPTGLQVQKLLAGMRDRGASAAVVECSTPALKAGHLQWLEPNLVVWTGSQEPTHEELQACGDHQSVLSSQFSLLAMLADPTSQVLVMNLDDPQAQAARAAVSSVWGLVNGVQQEGVPLVTYSVDNPEADVYAEEYRSSIWENEILVRTPSGRLQVITQLLGKHNVYNVLAAVAAGIALKVPLKSIVAGIEAVEVIPGRCEVIDESQPFSVIVDAASTPQQLAAMLACLRQAAGPGKRVFTVFGCRGEVGDKPSRSAMGAVAHAHSDYVIITNCDPAREEPNDIVQDIVAGLPDSVVSKYRGYVYWPFQDQGNVPLWFEPYLQSAQRATKRYVMEDRFSAIRAAIGTASEGDVVLVAGKGHEDFMLYGGEEKGGSEDGSAQAPIVRGWFDDRVECRHALSKLQYLYQLTKLQRKTLPWGDALDHMLTVHHPVKD